MKKESALKAIINKEGFTREELARYERFVNMVADRLVDFYIEKYAKSAANEIDNSTKSVEK